MPGSTTIYPQKPGLAGKSRNYRMPAHDISRSPNLPVLAVPLSACTRRAAPETDPDGLVNVFVQPPATPIPDTDTLKYFC